MFQKRGLMLLYEHSKPTEYPAEISGWGPHFFTELTTLCWSEKTGIVARCSRELHAKSTVYLRLLSVHGTRGPALPYRIGSAIKEPPGVWKLFLLPFREGHDGLGFPSDGKDTENLLGRPIPLDEICREHILRVLEACGGNRSRAAQILGIGRTSLYRFLLGK